MVQQLPYLADSLLDRFAVDTRMVQLPPAHVAGVPILDEGDYWAIYDRWGSKMRMPKQAGLYYDWFDYPIEATLESLDGYAWPEPDPIDVVATLADQAQWLHEHTDYALVGSGVIGGGIFEQACRTVGLETFMEAMLLNRPFAERLLDGITEIYIESATRYLDQVGAYIDVFTFWDDVCSQDGWMISPALYTTLIKPRQRRLFESIKAKTTARIFYHGCGAVFDLIPHLIEIGVDILNPVQVNAKGMDSARLKATYGKDVTFWGGGVDTQRVLPFGTVAEVRDEVKRRIDDFAPGGGFVFADRPQHPGVCPAREHRRRVRHGPRVRRPRRLTGRGPIRAASPGTSSEGDADDLNAGGRADQEGLGGGRGLTGAISCAAPVRALSQAITRRIGDRISAGVQSLLERSGQGRNAVSSSDRARNRGAIAQLGERLHGMQAPLSVVATAPRSRMKRAESPKLSSLNERR